MLRGGSWNGSEFGLRSSNRGYNDPSDQNYYIGFRVASVPEPSAMVLAALFGAGLVCRRKR